MSERAGVGRYRLFGFDLETDFPFATRLAPPADPPGAPDLGFRCRPGPPDGRARVAGPPLYRSPRVTEAGESLAELHRGAEAHLLRFPGLGDFRVADTAIDCQLDAAELAPSAPLVEIRLLGPVMAFWMERRGHVALHASAVAVDGRAVVFAAAGGGGKTSLAAALMTAGRPLLADDIVAVEAGPGETFRARPGYPQLRLWPEQAERFLGGRAGLARVHPEHEKLRAPVGTAGSIGAISESGFGEFCGRAVPIARIYLPARREPGSPDGSISITGLSPREALVELLKRSFSPAIAEAAGLAAARLDLLSRLVERVPVRRLAFPTSFERLGDVAAAVVADLGSG